MAKKYIGWGITYENKGQKAITIVPARTKKAAIEKLELLGLQVFEKEQIRHVCVVKYPGPPQVQEMKAQDWKCIKPLQEETNG